MTVLDHLQQVLAKAHHTNADAGVAPVCVLWPDGERHWEAALPQLRDALPQLFTFGDYAPAERQGPAAWLRCVLAGTIDGAVRTCRRFFTYRASRAKCCGAWTVAMPCSNR